MRHIRSLRLAACVACCLAGLALGAEDQSKEKAETTKAEATKAEATKPDTAKPEAAALPAGGKVATEEGQVIAAEEVEEPDLAELPLSNAARVRLDRARDSVVQIRGFFGAAKTSAFHGSGFAVGEDGLIVTNYHVVSEALLHPQRYHLEYVTSDDRSGKLRVYAVDIRNDLAVVKADDGLKLPPLRLRTDIPRQGARAYSIGFPLNLGLTITEGVANGLVDTGFDQRIHYTGAINGGMSGGPALDAGGGVYGVNVSVVTGRQLVGFVVPARHIDALLARAQAPLDKTLSAQQVRNLVAQQALTHEAVVLEPGPPEQATQTVFGFTLPARMGRAFDCSTTGSSEAPQRLQVETIGCFARAGVLLQLDLEVGRIEFQHRVLKAQGLHALQFAQRLNEMAEGSEHTGSARNVAPFACRDALVALDGFDARVTTCARQYRIFTGLYDIAVTVTSINSSERAVVSQLDMRGVGFEPGMQFVRRFLGVMQWKP
jgi:serine protease Do